MLYQRGPLCGGELDIVDARPGALVADELGLVQGVQGFRQGVVVADAGPSHRGKDPVVGHDFRVLGRCVLGGFSWSSQQFDREGVDDGGRVRGCGDQWCV